MTKQRHNGDNNAPRGPGAMARLRNYFLMGLIVAGPVGITLYLTWSLIEWVDGWVKPFIPTVYNPETYLPFAIPGLGLVVSFVGLVVLGFLTGFERASCVHVCRRPFRALSVCRRFVRGPRLVAALSAEFYFGAGRTSRIARARRDIDGGVSCKASSTRWDHGR